MEIGVAVPPIDDARTFAELLSAAEEAGVEAFWTYDAGRGEEPFARVGFLAAVTSHAWLCVGILNPFLRHPAVLAGGAATVDRLSAQRCRLVMGFGWSPDIENVLGITRQRPYADFQASVSVIKRLLAGEEVSYTGERFALSGAKLSLNPLRPDVPIYVAGGGKRGLEIAAKTADGYLADFGPDPRYVARIRDEVRRRRGRTEGFLLGVSLGFRVEDDEDAALAAARQSLAWRLATSTSTDLYFEIAGIEPNLVQAVRSALGLDTLIREKRNPMLAYADNERREAAARCLPMNVARDLVRHATLIGPLSWCVERLREMAAIGIDFVLLNFRLVSANDYPC